MSCNHQTNGGIDTSQTQRRARETVQGRAGNGAKRKTSCKQAQLSAKDETGDISATAEPIWTIERRSWRGRWALSTCGFVEETVEPMASDKRPGFCETKVAQNGLKRTWCDCERTERRAGMLIEQVGLLTFQTSPDERLR